MSDIHGSRHALAAVVADAAACGVCRWWVLGDLVAIGPDPVPVVELITNLPDLRASDVILHADRHGLRVEHHPVSYDQGAFLDAVARSGHPASDYIASFRRGEQLRHPARRPGAPEPTT